MSGGGTSGFLSHNFCQHAFVEVLIRFGSSFFFCILSGCECHSCFRLALLSASIIEHVDMSMHLVVPDALQKDIRHNDYKSDI